MKPNATHNQTIDQHMSIAANLPESPQAEAKTKKLTPAVPRGESFYLRARPGQTDWRINPRSYEFIGAIFDPLSPIQALTRAKWMTTQHSFRYIVTPNTDHLVRLSREPEVFGPLYKGSWLSVCDSRILELLAKFSGLPLKAVPGSDLTQQIFDTIITPSDTITVVGADATIIQYIKETYGLTTIHHYEPPYGLRDKPDEIAKAAEFIANHPARYIFLCVGSPQQEMIAKACSDRGDCVGLGLCIGASLNFLSGQTKRAPRWIQALRMEWLFRLAHEPRRLWKRYLIEGPKIFYLWIKWSLKRQA